MNTVISMLSNAMKKHLEVIFICQNISAIEIKKGSIYATGRKGEIDFGYDFVEKIVLSDKQDQPQTENVFLSAHEQLLKDEYSFMFKSNLNYPYFIEFDFTGKVITTNGGK